ncbi:DUF3392 domain-containing protein [Idiomarina xiamenensis]|uniref:DUF3392 domain-containing protein n=1 Tax=Idiomarina xiamenensis 10-D-4 TaxID=740709 RepID=K2JTV3_9GAMM|nr:DUF3392 domain-containing protein [Idiomarina xiamenensis]EKE86876.1 hypothetical protein A10D4_01502 [Idiomarina xiamenensis 10-D-4]
MLLQLANELGMMIRPHLYEFALIIMATLLVIYGNEINQVVRRQVSHWHFIFRTLVFVLVCAFGYGLLLIWLTPWLSSWLHSIPLRYLAVSCIAILLLLGVIAERKRQL